MSGRNIVVIVLSVNIFLNIKSITNPIFSPSLFTDGKIKIIDKKKCKMTIDHVIYGVE